jgi:PAS domain-containing protein
VSVILFSIVQFISEKRHAALLEKQVEERSNQLQALEERYRTLFIESKDTVFISSPGGRLIDINPAGVELFGFQSRDEAITMSSGLEIYDSRKTPLESSKMFLDSRKNLLESFNQHSTTPTGLAFLFFRPACCNFL